ncbi:unnamed protein product [Rhodiola kirilowii]
MTTFDSTTMLISVLLFQQRTDYMFMFQSSRTLAKKDCQFFC